MLDESTIKRDILKQIMKAMDGSVGEKVSSRLKPKEDAVSVTKVTASDPELLKEEMVDEEGTPEHEAMETPEVEAQEGEDNPDMEMIEKMLQNPKVMELLKKRLG